MEQLVEQLPNNTENLRSFDPAASINLYRFDIKSNGRILPETKLRVYDEELSYVAEGIDRPLKTEFTLQEVNNQLCYFDRGHWRPYIGTLITGLEVAKKEANDDPRKSFLVEKASFDLEIGFKLLKLKAGERIAWHSRFPQQELESFGADFISEQGFQVSRRMGFLYLAEKNVDGSLTLHSQSVDNDDHEAFELAMSEFNETPNLRIDSLRRSYDKKLKEKHGEDFYAGRRLDGTTSLENAWQEVHKHKDLLEYFFDQIEALAFQSNLSGLELEHAKKRLTYGVWAALRQRLETSAMPMETLPIIYSPSQEVLRHEIELAYTNLARRGEVLFGCGGAIKGEKAILNADSQDIFESIFSNEPGEDKYGSLTFECPKGHTNTRPRNKLIDKCKSCGISVKC